MNISLLHLCCAAVMTLGIGLSGCQGKNNASNAKKAESADKLASSATSHKTRSRGDSPAVNVIDLLRAEGLYFDKKTLKPYTGKLFKLVKNSATPVKNSATPVKNSATSPDFRKVTSYEIVRGVTHSQLAGEVRQKIHHYGWQPVAGGFRTHQGEFLQAMVKYEYHQAEPAKAEPAKAEPASQGAPVVQWMGSVVNGKAEGKRTWYHEKGYKTREANYKKGQLHGIRTKYRSAGSKESVANFKWGKLDGMHTVWHAGGAGHEPYKTESMYKNGKKDGHEIYTNAKGKELRKCTYSDGVKQSCLGEHPVPSLREKKGP